MGAKSTTVSSSQKVQWMWQVTKDPWDTNQHPGWECYSDVDNMIIEEAFQANEPYAILNNYKINFSRNVKIAKDSSRERPVKRVITNVESSDGLREMTLSNPIYVKPSIANRPGAFGDFIWEAYLLGQWRDVPQDVLVERAAQGIIEEGGKIGKEGEAKNIAQRLLEVKHGTRKEIWQRCAHLYGLESFLYKKLNETLRLVNYEEHKQEWRDRLQTLGLFAWFLFDFPQDADEFEGHAYRGACLSEEYIDYFKTVSETGELLAFPAFTGTSANRSKSEQFGSNNTLFIISIVRSRETSVNISDISEHPDEEERLLVPGFLFKVIRVEFDSPKKIYLIYLQDCNHQ